MGDDVGGGIDLKNDEDLFLVCELFCRRPEMRQKDIAKELGLTQKKVSGLIKEGHTRGLITRMFCPPYSHSLSKPLAAWLKKMGVREAIVAEGRGATVGAVAARFFEKTAIDGNSVVLDGGLTVGRFVDSLLPNQFANLRLIPICADPASYQDSAYELVMRMAAKFSVGTVSDKLPYWEGPQLVRAGKAARSNAKKATFVFLGGGPLEGKFTASEFVEHLGLNAKTFRQRYKNSVAALSGYCAVSKDGQHVPLPEVDEKLPRAISFSDLQHIAKARKRHSVLLASGREKAGAVAAILSSSICNTLIVDSDLAGELNLRAQESSR